MIKKYNFEYEYHGAEASFRVDTGKFTNKHAQATLDFFTWSYDEDADPIDEVMKKYAMEAIRLATFNNYNTYGVVNAFNDHEGYCNVDGSYGIELISVSGHEFNADDLDMTIVSE